MFIQTWAITGSLPEISSRNFTNMFYPVLITAVLSGLSNLLFLRTARASYFSGLAAGLGDLKELIAVSNKNFAAEVDHWFSLPDNQRRSSLAKYFLRTSEVVLKERKLRASLSSLRRSKMMSSYEWAYTHVSVTQISYLLPYLVSCHRHFQAGMGMILPMTDLERDIWSSSWKQDEEAPGTSNDEHQTAGTSGLIEVTVDMAYKTAKDEASSLSLVLGNVVDIIQAVVESFGYIEKSHENLNTMKVTRALSRYLRKDKSGPENPLETTSVARQSLDLSIQKARDALYELLRCRGFDEESHSSRADNCSSEGPTTPPHSQAASPFRRESSIKFKSPKLFRSDMYAIAQYSLSLMEMAEKTIEVLDQVENTIRELQRHPKRRVFHPVMDIRQWLVWTNTVPWKAEPFATGAPSYHDIDDADVKDRTENSRLEPFPVEEADPLASYKMYALRVAEASNREEGLQNRKQLHWKIQNVIRMFSRKKVVVQIRLAISAFLHDLKKSRHIQFALKLAGGVTLLSMICFLEPDPHSWWNRMNGQWMVISYIWCLEGSTGDSIRISLCRLIGTILGGLLGFIAYEISRGNVYGLSVLLVLFEIPASILRMHSIFPPPLGTVMGLTTPIVAVVSYLSPEKNEELHIALVRCYMIILGILAALVVNIAFWPYHARNRLMQKFYNSLTLMQSIYVVLSQQMFYTSFRATPEFSKALTSLEKSITRQHEQCRALLVMMRDEISLVPKPMDVLATLCERLDVTFSLIVTLRKCRETGLLKSYNEAVMEVVHLRQELVSTVLLNFWMLAQTMLTRMRMPQTYPSSRRALDELTAAIALGYHEVIQEGSYPATGAWRKTYDGPTIGEALDIPLVTPLRTVKESRQARHTIEGLVFVLAEHSILEQIVSSIEVMMQLTRLLMGEVRVVR